MPGSATRYLEQAVLGHTLGYAAMAMPPGTFIALTVTEPTATTPGTEVSGGGYARQSGTFAPTATPNLAANAATIEYPAATSGWGIVGWFEIWDAVSSGNRLYWGPLVDPADGITPIQRTVLTGDVMRFSAGVIQVQAI